MSGFVALPKEGYALEECGDHAFLACMHSLGGVGGLRGAWCPNCAKPLLPLATFDASDTRLEVLADELAEIPLLFCWRCGVTDAPLVYRIVGRGAAVSLLSWGAGPPHPDFPYPLYPDCFERVAVRLSPLGHRQAVIRELNMRGHPWGLVSEYPDLSRPSNQVGGEPILLQGCEPPTCPGCCCSMPFFAAIGDAAGGGRKFTGNDFVHVLFHLCRSCKVIVARQFSD